MSTDHASLIAVLNGFLCHVQQPLGPKVAILVGVKVQVKISLFGQLKDPEASLGDVHDASDAIASKGSRGIWITVLLVLLMSVLFAFVTVSDRG